MKRNISQLLKELTLEEKAGLCSGQDFWHLKGIERLDVPGVMVSDGPHGLRKQDDKADHLGIHDSIEAVCFPAACATAASFDTEMLKELGSLLGEECRSEKVAVLLGPALNIKRSPLCGRNFEYFSEDPYVAGKLAAAQVCGIQSWAVGACPKHFAANNQEYRRMTCSSQVDERTLREIYLAAFETVVKEAGPWTMMCSYNRINGVFASENQWLLTRILREEWGFDGYVMSDWGAVNDRVEGLEAGLDLEMPASGGVNDAKIVQAVREGSLEESVLDKAAERILDVVFRYADEDRPGAAFDREEHHERAAGMAGSPGSEVVQLYVSDGTGTPGRPVKELKGFVKLTLEPGQTGEAGFELNSRSLACYSEQMGDWYAPAGSYQLLAGASSRDIRQTAVISYQTDRQPALTVDENTTFGELMAHPVTAPAMKELLGRMKGVLGDGGDAVSGEMSRKLLENAPLRAVQGFAHLPDEALQNMIARFNQLLGV